MSWNRKKGSLGPWKRGEITLRNQGVGLGRRSQEKQGRGRPEALREFKNSAFFISPMESWNELASGLGGAQAPPHPQLTWAS